MVKFSSAIFFILTWHIEELRAKKRFLSEYLLAFECKFFSFSCWNAFLRCPIFALSFNWSVIMCLNYFTTLTISTCNEMDEIEVRKWRWWWQWSMVISKANKMRGKFLISAGEKSKSCEKHFQVRQLHDIKRPKRWILLHRKIFISSLTSSSPHTQLMLLILLWKQKTSLILFFFFFFTAPHSPLIFFFPLNLI